jgi:hypothetical protein
MSAAPTSSMSRRLWRSLAQGKHAADPERQARPGAGHTGRSRARKQRRATRTNQSNRLQLTRCGAARRPQGGAVRAAADLSDRGRPGAWRRAGQHCRGDRERGGPGWLADQRHRHPAQSQLRAAAGRHAARGRSSACSACESGDSSLVDQSRRAPPAAAQGRAARRARAQGPLESAHWQLSDDRDSVRDNGQQRGAALRDGPRGQERVRHLPPLARSVMTLHARRSAARALRARHGARRSRARSSCNWRARRATRSCARCPFIAHYIQAAS